MISGGSASVPDNVCDDWKNNLRELILDMIPSMFTTWMRLVCFYALPNKTLRVKGQDYKGARISKEKIPAAGGRETYKTK